MPVSANPGRPSVSSTSGSGRGRPVAAGPGLSILQAAYTGGGIALLQGMAAALAAAEPLWGRWKLNLAKSQYRVGAPPKAQTVVIAEEGRTAAPRPPKRRLLLAAPRGHRRLNRFRTSAPAKPKW